MGKILKFGAFLVIVGFVAVIVGLVATGNTQPIQSEEYEYKTESIEMGSISLVSMIMDNRRVIVGRSTTGKIEMDYYESEKDPVEVTVSADSVLLENEFKWYENLFRFWPWTLNDDYTVAHLYLPEGVDYELNLETSNGDITIEDLNNLNDLTLDTSNGTITLSNLTAEGITAESSNGALILTNLTAHFCIADTSNGRVTASNITATVGQIHLDTSNGAVNGTNLTTNNLSCDTSNGSIDITITGSEADFYYDLSTSNGTVYVDGDDRGDSERENTSMTNRITLTTSNGSIHLDFAE